MNRASYNLLFHLALPFIVLRLLWRALRAPAYARRWSERFGHVEKIRRSRSEPQWVWVHAVSVGEVVAAVPFINALLEQHPTYGVVVTTMTPTGSERVRALLGDKVCHVYAPYDYSGAVKRFLRVFKPALLVLMETELWPNTVHYTRGSGARVLVVNARLSEKSFRGYAKFAKLGLPMLRQINGFAVQAAPDAERLQKLGVMPQNLHITGSLKFDLELPPDLDQTSAALAGSIEGERPRWIAASTRSDGALNEEEKVLTAFQQCLQQIPNLLLILVPRHPERFKLAEKLCQERGLTVIRRSSMQPVQLSTQVLLGDSMGEMLSYYRISNIAFVGGSLVNTGCQNVLEPAALGLPVLTGPSQFNFQTICELLQEVGALHTVRNESELAQEVCRLLLDAETRAQMGAAGRQLVAENRGALPRIMLLVNEQLNLSA